MNSNCTKCGAAALVLFAAVALSQPAVAVAAVTLTMGGQFVTKPPLSHQSGTPALDAAFGVPVPTPWSVVMTLNSFGYSDEWAITDFTFQIADRVIAGPGTTPPGGTSGAQLLSNNTLRFLARAQGDFVPTLSGDEYMVFSLHFNVGEDVVYPFNDTVDYLFTPGHSGFSITNATYTGTVFYQGAVPSSVGLEGEFQASWGIPEPSTWLTMVLGFGAVGAAFRGRHVARIRGRARRRPSPGDRSRQPASGWS